MFGIGTSELILILILALLIIGPKELPKISKEVGKVFRSIRNTTDGIKDSITREMEDFGREGESRNKEESKD